MRALIRVLAFSFALVFVAPAGARTDEPAQLAFEWPAAGTLTAPFGEPRGGHFHPGLDIGILRSLDVRAAAPGRVTAAGYVTGYEGYGLVVETELVGGFRALYAHLAAASVGVGEWIQAGDPIGTAGCTGWCTGTHLHFELRLFGSPVDPLGLFRVLGYNRSF